MSSLPTSPNRPGAAPLQTLPRSPLGPVTNVSQRFAELDRALDQAQEDNQEIFSQDDQLQDSSLPGTAPSPLLKKRADPKPASTAALKAKKGKAKSTSAEGSSSKDANKLIELGINVALAAPSTNAKGKAVKVSTKDCMTRCAKDTTFADFKSKIIAAAVESGLSISSYDTLSIEGKIPAGGIWKDRKRLHHQDAFSSFWEKILNKKAWEGYVFVSPSATAAIEISSDSGTDIEAVKSEPESTNDVEVDTKEKRKSNEGSDKVDAGPSSNTSKRAKIAVKDEAEEARKKTAADILRRHACSKHGAKACFVLRGGVHLAVDNEVLDRWIAAIERDPIANTSAHLPNDKHIDRKTKEAYAKHRLRSPARRDRSASPHDYAMQSDDDDELPNVLLSSAMSRFRRRSGGLPSAGPSSSSAMARRVSSDTQMRSSGPDMTFEALAKHVKLDEAIVTKLIKVGVRKQVLSLG